VTTWSSWSSGASRRRSSDGRGPRLRLTGAGDAIQGLSGRDALRAAARALRDFVLAHPGRYAATLGLEPAGPDDPLAVAAIKGREPFAAVLRGYDVDRGLRAKSAD
jgi:hypothetical protein